MFGDKAAPRVKTRGRAGEREGDKEAHEAEDRAIERAQACLPILT